MTRDRETRADPGPAERRRQGRWLVPAALGAGLLVAVLGAWFSAPAWLPALAAGQLPDGWRMESLSIDRPGLRATRIERGRVVAERAGLELSVGIEGGNVLYAGPQLEVERLTVDLRQRPAAPREAPTGDSASLDEFSLPRLIPPGGLPAVRIGALDLTWHGGGAGDAPRRWRFTDLDLDPSAEQLRLDARLEPPNAFGAELTFVLELAGQQLALTVHRDGHPAPLLRLSQSRDPGRGDTRAEAALDVDLAWLDTDLLAPVTAALGLAPPDEAGGQVRASAVFRGSDRLHPERAELQADALRLRSGDALAQGAVQLSVRRDGDDVRLTSERLSLTLEGEMPGMEERLRSALSSLGLEGRLGATEGALTLSGLEATLPLRGRPSDAEFSTGFALRGRLDRALLRHAEGQGAGATSGTYDLEGTLAREPSGGLRGDGVIHTLRFDDFSFSDPGTTLRLGGLTVGGRFAWDGDNLSWSGPVSGTGLAVAPADAIAGTSLLAATALSFQLAVTGDTDLAVTGEGRLDGALLPDLGLTLDSVAIDIDTLALPAVDGRLGLLTTGLEARVDGDRYAGLDLDLDGELRGGSRFRGEGELLVGFSASLPFSFAADLDAASLTATLDRASLPATALGDAARILSLPLPRALGFTDGQLVLDGAVELGENGLGGELTVRGDALGLTLGESRVEGLEFESRVALEDVINGNGPLTLRLAQLAAGLDLVAMDTAVTFRGADVGLLELDAELLGGRLSSPRLQLSGGQLMDTLIRWEGFDLGRLLAFVDVSGLEGTGTLDAELPVLNDGGGPSVTDGWFKARGPGVLRYGTGVPATNIGLQALENFQYDTLEGTLAYGSDGAYTISVDLLGRNPDLYGGHPVRFRLNIGGEMPALFRSLFVTGNFEEAIIERLRAGEAPLEENP